MGVKSWLQTILPAMVAAMNDKQLQKAIRDNGAGTFTFNKDTFPGLYYRVSPQGKVAWVYRYNRPGTGKPAQPKMGDYGSEKEGKLGIAAIGSKWLEWRKLLAEGIDPQYQVKEQREAVAAKQAVAEETVAANGLTVRKLQRDYVDHISRPGGLKSWKSVSSKLDAALQDHMDMPATELTRPNVKAILKRITNSGKPVMANRTLAAIRSMYNWAIKNDWPCQDEDECEGVLTSNPCLQIEANKETPREHSLTKTELKRLFKYLPKTSLTPDQQDVLLFTLYTGCRIGEACQVEWADIHDDEWLQPGIKTKNGHAHTVYLTQPVLDILERHEGGRYVFDSKTTDSGHIRLDGVEKQLRLSMDKLKVRPHRIHDYRRTFASWMGDAGIDETVHDRCLNHVISVGVRKTYNTSRYNQPAREAWQAWADYLQELQP